MIQNFIFLIVKSKDPSSLAFFYISKIIIEKCIGYDERFVDAIWILKIIAWYPMPRVRNYTTQVCVFSVIMDIYNIFLIVNHFLRWSYLRRNGTSTWQ
jgi:hypothetical protein